MHQHLVRLPPLSQATLAAPIAAAAPAASSASCLPTPVAAAAAAAAPSKNNESWKKTFAAAPTAPSLPLLRFLRRTLASSFTPTTPRRLYLPFTLGEFEFFCSFPQILIAWNNFFHYICPLSVPAAFASITLEVQGKELKQQCPDPEVLSVARRNTAPGWAKEEKCKDVFGEMRLLIRRLLGPRDQLLRPRRSRRQPRRLQPSSADRLGRLLETSCVFSGSGSFFFISSCNFRYLDFLYTIAHRYYAAECHF